MPRFLSWAFLGASLALSATAQGGDFWARVHLDFQRVNCWPEPFVRGDQDVVRRPLMLMTNRGWQLQNTLSDHFFHEDDHTLTRAGEYKLRWIVTQAPAHRRTVYVLRSTNSFATDERMAFVRDYVDGITQEGTRPEVLVSDVAPSGGRGDYFDAVDQQLKASVPAPRLPERSGVAEMGG